jgi:hypothetical protein
MEHTLARDGEPTAVGPAQAPVTDRGMQILEYAVAGLAIVAALMLAFLR